MTSSALLAVTGFSNWFSVAWIALVGTWIVLRFSRTRDIWSRRPRPAMSVGDEQTVDFALTPDEASTFGIHLSGTTLVVGPDRARQLVALGLPSGVVIVALFVATSGIPPFAIVMSLLVAGVAAAYAWSSRSEGVTLTPYDLTVQGRTGDPRVFPWGEVIDVVVDPRDGHDVAVLHALGERPIDLPGIAGADAAAKVATIVRYRMAVHAR